MEKIKATHLLILASIITSLYSWVYGADLAFSAKSLAQKNYLSLITALFAHAGTLHLFGNMAFLYIFGSTLEKEMGGAKVLFAFLTGGIAAFLLSIPFYPHAEMLGASAAIFTLAAITMLTKPLSFSIILLMPVGAAALLFFIYNVIAIAAGAGGNTAFVSHAIGFLLGAGMGIGWSGNWKKNLVITIVSLVAYAALVNLALGFFQA